jgi:predicted RNA binding protein YcfA (HicA-like mRNA interferase family)
MTKLPIVTPQEMEKILVKLGFKKIRQKGSHAYFSHSDGRATVVPVHKGEDLGRGLIRSILNDIEISREEYEKLRRCI